MRRLEAMLYARVAPARLRPVGISYGRPRTHEHLNPNHRKSDFCHRFGAVKSRARNYRFSAYGN
jgi:hypothetical protein